MAKTIYFTSGELWFIANALVLAGEEYSRLAEVKIYPESLRAEFRRQRDIASIGLDIKRTGRAMYSLIILP